MFGAAGVGFKMHSTSCILLSHGKFATSLKAENFHSSSVAFLPLHLRLCPASDMSTATFPSVYGVQGGQRPEVQLEPGALGFGEPLSARKRPHAVLCGAAAIRKPWHAGARVEELEGLTLGLGNANVGVKW